MAVNGGTVVGNRDFGKNGGAGSGCGTGNLKAAGWGKMGSREVGSWEGKSGEGGGKCGLGNREGKA